MNRKTNLKAVSDEKPEQLTYEQLRGLAEDIASRCAGNDFLPPALMVLTREIIDHCFDASHVETVAMILEDKLFAQTGEFDRAQRAYIRRERERLLKP